MKKVMTIGLAALMAASLLSSASAAPKKQVVDGVVALPAPFVDDSGCFAGLHRRMAIATQENVNGVLGFHFDIDKATAGGKFKLEPTGGQGHIDFDILFYEKFGTIEDVVGDPAGAGAPATVGFQTREAGGEAGVVPAGMPKAIVCMYGGQQGTGVGGTFTYTATPPKKKK